jgi:hypothetical protein
MCDVGGTAGTATWQVRSLLQNGHVQQMWSNRIPSARSSLEVQHRVTVLNTTA